MPNGEHELGSLGGTKQDCIADEGKSDSAQIDVEDDPDRDVERGQDHSSDSDDDNANLGAEVRRFVTSLDMRGNPGMTSGRSRVRIDVRILKHTVL